MHSKHPTRHRVLHVHARVLTNAHKRTHPLPVRTSTLDLYEQFVRLSNKVMWHKLIDLYIGIPFFLPVRIDAYS